MERKYMNRYLDDIQKNQLNFVIRNHKRYFLITVGALLILTSFILGMLLVKPSIVCIFLARLYSINIERLLLIILIIFLTVVIIFISKKLQLIIAATEFQNMLFSNSTKKLCNFFLICDSQGEIFYKDERAKNILTGTDKSEEKTLAIFGEKYKKQILKNLQADYQFNFNEYIISVTKMARPEGYFLISGHNDKKLVLYDELLQEAGICTYIIDNNTLVEANANYKKYFGSQFPSNNTTDNTLQQNEICSKFAINGYYFFFSHYFLVKNNIKYALLIPKIPQLNELVKKLPLPIAIFNKNLRLLDFNEKFRALSGLNESNSNVNISNSNINNYNANNISANIASNNNINKLLKNKFALEEEQEIAIVELPFNNGNNTKAYITKIEELFIGIFTDFNTVHELQTKLEHFQKVSSIGELTGGIAHDFNNILTAILGFCEILLDNIDEKNQHYFDIYQIKNSAEKGSQLVKKLLAFARKQILTTEIININEVIEGLHPILQRLINEDIHLEYYLARNLKSVKIDKGQFEQVLINLVLNARDSIKNGGKLIIETSNIIIDTKIVVLNNTALQETILKGEYIKLSVKDTGSGIGAETLPKIFDPFFSTKGAAGTGFGLSTAYGIIKQFKGYIDVKSSVKTASKSEEQQFNVSNISNSITADRNSKDFNYSTEFSIFIPTCYEQKEEKELQTEILGSFNLSLKPKVKAAELLTAQETAKTQASNLHTIMLVEDEQMIKDFLTKMLNKQGFQVITCKNSQEALKVFECNSVDIIITDVIMPGLSGPELIEEIQKLPAKDASIRKDLKVIFISGYTREKLQTDNLSKNYFFLEKPFTSKALLKLITEALEPEKRG